MRDLNLDASTWKNADDFYNSFFKAVGPLNGMAEILTLWMTALRTGGSTKSKCLTESSFETYHRVTMKLAYSFAISKT